MALVWHEKASRTALQTSSLSHTHTLLVQTHNMTTAKEIAEQCRPCCSTILFVKSRTTQKALMKSAQFFFFIPFKYSLCIFFILLNKFSIITKNFIEFLKFNTCVIFYFSFSLKGPMGGGNLTPRPLQFFLHNLINIDLRLLKFSVFPQYSQFSFQA